jgi:FKBP-type peptidyl-prolyl cis-trans isomerase
MLCEFMLVLATSWTVPQEGEPPIPADTNIQTTDSGIQFSILRAASGGPRPMMGEIVRVNYTGWLTDGTVFDSSFKRGEPSQFQLGQVIPGWNEGLQQMTVGSKFKFTIPPALAYGDQDVGPIPANSTLIFEIELLEILPLPEHQPLEDQKLKTTTTGLKYQCIKQGKGECAQESDVVELKYAFWGPREELVECSDTTGETMKAPVSRMNLAFLKEALLLMTPGSVFLFEVPPDLCFGEQRHPQLAPNSTTTWRLELVNVVAPLPLPEFVPFDEATATKTPSGLWLQKVREGEGVSPRMGEQVTVHYCGWLADGTNFDSSYARGEPSTFHLGRVIPGWNEGLQLMKTGAVYRLKVPSNLAYGARGSPGGIPPHATLLFLIELIKVGP